MDTEAFDFVLGTDFFVQHSQIQSLTLQAPYLLHVNHGSARVGKVLTKVALERSRMALCSPDWGAHGGNEYWQNLLDRLTISSVR